MTPGEETHSNAVPNTRVSSVRLRVGDIGQVTGIGQCWRLAYDGCDHLQQFAQEGLEDPDRLALFVQRNFRECLTCRLEVAALGKICPLPLDVDNAVPDVMLGASPKAL